MTMTATMIAPDARVLVIAVARIGDTLLATPMLRALKSASPAGRLEVQAHPKRLDVLRHLPFIDRLSSITKFSARLRGHLSRKRFDWAFVFGQDAPLLRYALRVSNRVVAFRQADASLNRQLHDAVEEPLPTPHAVQHRLLLLRNTGVSASDLRLAWQCTAAEQAGARAWLNTHIAASARPVIGLQMASFHTKSHRDWPVKRFVELAQRIVGEWPEAFFVLLGDSQSLASAGRFSQALPKNSFIAAGQLPLRESAAVMAQLDLYVGVDTGPTHIAGALGVPMVALYHPAYPGRNLAPLQNPHCRAVEHPLVGSRAGADSDAGDMADISVERVWTECAELLQQKDKLP